MSTPGFLKNGIDFEQLVKHYLANGCYITITDPAEIKLAIDLMQHIIDTSYGYDDEGSFASTIHGRFQMIFNSTLQEMLVRERGGLIKRSNAIWLLEDHYEKGADFKSNNNVDIETKVYKNVDSMKAYAKKGSTVYTVFHGAGYVLCYLIDSFESQHWYWLKNINGTYTVYTDEALASLTSECLPEALPVCYCKLSDTKLVIGRNTFCK